MGTLTKVLQHALFCQVCNRSLCIISVEAEMAEEYEFQGGIQDFEMGGEFL